MGISQSSITFSQAKTRVAAAAGASSTSELTRAGYAIQAAFQDWNNDEAWNFLRVVATDITVVAGTADYSLPTDFKYIYTARLTGNARPLMPLPQKLYDLTVWTSQAGTPIYFNLFKAGMDTMQITLIPTPDVSDTLSIKYHRSLAIPSADADILDIPVDYESYLLAQSKYLYLLDKGSEFAPQLQGWKDFYESGKRKAIAAETRRPQEDKLFIPEGSLPLNTTGLDIPDIFYMPEN